MKIALPLLIAFGLAGAAVAQDAGKSVWQGIYTPEQADRGGGVYAQRCGACHGAALTGVQPATPGLLGLPRDYINAQLGAWRTGQRKAHAPDCMADIAQRLDIQDIAAVSAWLSRYDEKPATQRSYRKETERFLLWCAQELKKPLSTKVV